MAKNKNPWDENWEHLSSLGEGGQGWTFKVQNKETGLIAVCKKLKGKREQSKKRFAREVQSMKILTHNNSNIKVPKVLEDNVDDLDSDVLYFIMEFIDGERLSKFAQNYETGAPFKLAVKLTLDLIETFEQAHELEIYHRDVKPDNLIVKDEAVYVIDYGLSWNNEDEDVTQVDEEFKNNFMHLPERAQAGGRRDPRSDIASVVGIFFYLLTKKEPKYLEDSANDPPHKKTDFSKLGLSDMEANNLINLFSIGFKLNIELRFQDFETLKSRITGLASEESQFDIDIFAYAKNTSNEIFLKNRKAQLAKFNELLNSSLSKMKVSNILGNHRIESFSFHDNRNGYGNYQTGDVLNEKFQVTCTHTSSQFRVLGEFYFISKKFECCLCYRVVELISSNKITHSEVAHEEIQWFDPEGDKQFIEELVKKHLPLILKKMVDYLKKKILE